MIAVLVAFGLGSKAYSGPGEAWIRGSAGGHLLRRVWILAWLWVRPRTQVGSLTVVVTVVTCGIEFAQLWHPPWLDALRDTRVGGLLLGSTFAWSDFPAYLIGGVVGYALGRWSASRSGRGTSEGPH